MPSATWNSFVASCLTATAALVTVDHPHPRRFIVSTRSVRCSVVVAAFVSLATLSTSAHAQPACAVGILSDYLALTGGCTIGGVTFTDFQAQFGAFMPP